MSERPAQPYTAGESSSTRRYSAEPSGPLETLVLCAARELHDAERPGEDWFDLVGSSVTSFCRRAMEARGLEWRWIMDGIASERLNETTKKR